MLKPRWRKPRYWASAAPIFPAPTITTRHSLPEPEDLAQRGRRARARNSRARACRTTRRTRGPFGPAPRSSRRASPALRWIWSSVRAPRSPRESGGRPRGGGPWNLRCVSRIRAACEFIHKLAAYEPHQPLASCTAARDRGARLALRVMPVHVSSEIGRLRSVSRALARAGAARRHARATAPTTSTTTSSTPSRRAARAPPLHRHPRAVHDGLPGPRPARRRARERRSRASC